MVNRYTSNVYHVRNMCLGGDVTKGARQKPFQGNAKYDYLVWIDTDIVFCFNDLKKLLESKYDVTTGIYTYNGTNNITNLVQKFDYDYYNID